MRAPLGELPRQLDRYGVAEALDTHLGEGGGVRHLLARDHTTGQLVVLMVVPAGPEADDEGYRLRFLAEAGKSRRLNGRSAAPVTCLAPPESPLPWVAYGVGPALPLPAALAAHGGPLPEEAVRALGAALAETLLDAHRNGLVHAGISPETVLLTSAGPALTGFGLVRAASPEGAARHAVPGVAPESLPPEQRAGDRPQPLGDVYALGSVLAYAATGVRAPAAHRLPESLRPVIGATFAQDSAARPQADKLLAQLAPHGTPASGGMEPPASILWVLEDQANRHRSMAPPPPYVPEQPGHPAQTPSAPTSGGTETRPSPRRSPGRRALLAGITYGALGLGAGAAAVGGWRATRSDPEPPRDPLAVPGTPPAPLWRFASYGGKQWVSLVPAGRRRAALVVETGGPTGVDLVTGKRLWSRDDMVLSEPPVHVGGGLLLLREEDSFSLVSAHTGKAKWTEEKYGSKAEDSVDRILTVHDGTLYFLTRTWTETADTEFTVKAVAYRLRDRKELWSRTLPSGYGSSMDPQDLDVGPLVDGGTLLLPNNPYDSGGKPFTYLALDVRDGRRKWERGHRGINVSATQLNRLAPNGLILTGKKKGYVEARSARTGSVRWRSKVQGHASAPSALGNGTLYVVNDDETMYAFDLRDGRRKWRRRWPGAPMLLGAGRTRESPMELSASGKVLLVSSSEGVVAFGASDGKLLWRFAAVAAEGVGPPSRNESFAAAPGAVVGQVPGMVLVTTPNALYALPVD
ncbi:PQQ-binding-like beta-propeller repeat protein [Streptomyces sp. NPDC048172]|uniref:outer membrane protein assembly factor BamB family protein n=1 Tax=Streptomyces sp. NPDC048172 TaxID=3365505 RepID=UPI00371EDA5C